MKSSQQQQALLPRHPDCNCLVASLGDHEECAEPRVDDQVNFRDQRAQLAMRVRAPVVIPQVFGTGFGANAAKAIGQPGDTCDVPQRGAVYGSDDGVGAWFERAIRVGQHGEQKRE